MDLILCPYCYVPGEGEEKCCSHGTGFGVQCVRCRSIRSQSDPPWICLGGVDMPDQAVVDERVRILDEVCKWLDKNGHAAAAKAIFDKRQHIFSPETFGRLIGKDR